MMLSGPKKRTSWLILFICFSLSYKYRYNKSGGCVCRHCRWVLCKEEKRKAMHLIDQMRQSRPDGQVDPEEDIDLFFCTPKYWNCGRPWKVGWILNSQHDAEDEEMMMGHSPSLSEATL